MTIQGTKISIEPDKKPIYSIKNEIHNDKQAFAELLDFLEKNYKTFKHSNTTSKIVIVDDQYSSRMSIRLNFEDMGL